MMKIELKLSHKLKIKLYENRNIKQKLKKRIVYIWIYDIYEIKHNVNLKYVIKIKLPVT